MLSYSFTNSCLWAAIAQKRAGDPHADLVVSSALPALTNAETLLRSAGTSPTDFTLHDADHAFRVAEGMAGLIPAETWDRLSLYELVLLLLSAYLHDIGMVPELSRAHAVHDYILTSDRSSLSDAELAALIKWFERNGIQTLIGDGTHGVESLRRAREAAAHYCRFRHNDWSEEWIRQNVVLDEAYGGCVDDLVLICRSHHEGYSRLLSSHFDPLHVPGTGDVVHRRYLACVLRIADILDVDPERTPPVIYRHRNIGDASEVFWKKDQAIEILLSNDTVHFAAEPVSAVLHKAIELTADGIEQELQTCYRISTEKPFTYDLVIPGKNLPHSWRLRPYLHRIITPRNGAYEYIDGAFRPNSDKVLQLLGSQELYTSPITAIRELLQNAFDGVRERIAITHLQYTSDRPGATEVANRFAVTLTLEADGGDAILICQDDGAGMTKEIIQNHFLISGNSVRPDLQSLAWHCDKRGIKLERTGQFGIGVLSYFLLADRIEVATRRAPECGDDDGTAWNFQTEGVGSFGELRRSSNGRVGTAVTLRLRRSFIGNLESFAKAVGEFVENAIVKSPCRFQFNANGKNVWATSAGWTRDAAKLNRLAFQWMGHAATELESARSKPLVCSEAVANQAQAAATMSAIHEATIKSVVWHTSDEVEIEALGVCRIHVPSFMINGQHAPYFMYARPGSDGTALKAFDFEHGITIGMAANDTTVMSWKGMSIHARSVQDMHYTVWEIIPNWEDVIVEIDITNNRAGKLSLNREFLDIQDDDAIHHFIDGKCRKHIMHFKSTVAERLANSPYASLWYTRRNSRKVPQQVPKYWSPTSSNSEVVKSGFVEWCLVDLPAVDRIDWLQHTSLTFRNNSVREQHRLSRCAASSWAGMTLPWTPTGMSLLCKNGEHIAVVPVWLNVDDSIDYCEAATEYGSYQRIANFPPAWSDVVGVSPPESAPIWNAAFPPVLAYRKAAKEWLLDQCKNGFWWEANESVQIVSAAMGNPSHESAILLNCLESSQRWISLTKVAPELTSQLWDRWVGRTRCLHYVRHSAKANRLETNHNVFSREGCETSSDLEALPDPGPDWHIEVS